MNGENFEEILKRNAERMAKSPNLKEHARDMNCEWRSFKVGGWDAMIFDIARSLNLRKCAKREYRRNLIERWLREGLGE